MPRMYMDLNMYIFKIFCLYFGERAHTGRRAEGQKRGERDKHTLLRAEPDLGLDLMTVKS